MKSLADLEALFARLGLAHTAAAHAPVSPAAPWPAVLRDAGAAQAAAGAVLTRALLLKPKAKAAAPLLVLLRDDAPAGVSAIARALGAKDARLASEDLIRELFGGDKTGVCLFSPSALADKAAVQVAVDAALLALPDAAQLGLRPFAADRTLFVAAGAFRAYLAAEGLEYTPVDIDALAAGAAASPAPPAASAKSPTSAKDEKPTDDKEIKIGIDAKKAEDFSAWYQQVIYRTEMLSNYDVSGCYILRPNAYKIWKEIQAFFGKEIEKLGVEDAYFPMFVTKKALEREKDHIEGFAPEVAWVTKAGQSELAEHIAIRPTSETVMYPAYENWIRSHRDLPLRLNQWCNVVRWEFKHPQPFLRTREFLWQEGHTAFATKEEADAEVRQILDLYRQVYEDLLAVPVICGVKSEKEKFAGGLYTTTCEALIPSSGRAIQGATSHCLGQNFAKMFNILYEAEGAGARKHVWQNSWGITTRTIGVMVMVHGDDKGLVMPPRVANTQVVVIPVGITARTTEDERRKISVKTDEIVESLKQGGIRVKSDLRDNYTPGFKYNHWEMRGVCIRLEVGPQDLAKNEVRCVTRFDGTKQQLPIAGLAERVKQLLAQIQDDMFARARATRDAQLATVQRFEDGFVQKLDQKCIVLAPWCEETPCEESVKERSARGSDDPADDERAPSMGAKTLCIPFAQPAEPAIVAGKTKCFACERMAKRYTLWGRSY